MMKQIMALTAGIFVAAAAFATDADAWERNSTITGPAGNSAHVEAYGSRGGGQWSRNRTITGPNGNTATLGATGSCYGGECTVERHRTGPAGNTVTRRSTIRR
jgi:hypothetical protein